MEEKEILSKLCYYDKRNPNSVYEYKEFIDEIGFDIPEKASKTCICDNCFYGRTALAEELIRLREYLR